MILRRNTPTQRVKRTSSSASSAAKGGGYKCSKCHRRKVATQGAKCGPCSKPPKSKSNNGRGHAASSRPVTGNAWAVVARGEDCYATRTPGCCTLVTTDDVLRLHNPPLSQLTASVAQFQQASAIADGFNMWFQQVQVQVCHA